MRKEEERERELFIYASQHRIKDLDTAERHMMQANTEFDCFEVAEISRS